MRTQPNNPKPNIAFGYQEWMDELKQKGFEIFFVTIMFDFNRQPEPTMRSMRVAVERCYSHLLTSLYRRPQKLPSIEAMPLLVAFAEAPSKKQQAIGKSKTWGTHFHGFLAIPPKSQARLSHLDALKKFKEFAKCEVPIILRMHIERARDAKRIANYSWKGRDGRCENFLDQFDILLPRRREEMLFADSTPRKSRRVRPKLIEVARRTTSPARPHITNRNDTMATSKLLTRVEVAEAIQVSLVKLDRMRLEGDAPPEIKIGRSVRFPEAAFERWLSNQYSSKSKPAEKLERIDSTSRHVGTRPTTRRFARFRTAAKSASVRKLR